MSQVDLSTYQNALSRKNQIARFVFSMVWLLFVRPLPRSIGKGWKRFILQCFGAKLHPTAHVYSSVRIYMPWNLEMHAHSCLAPEVDCYNVAKISIGAHSTVSQKSYLCAASHDISKPQHPLIYKPIVIADQVWVGAEAFIGMGVHVGEGAVVGARAAVFKDVAPWTIVGGNPAKYIKDRVIINHE